ncbi:hypothetical protein [Paraflavitalea speifideaquila]|uniref:TonB-dependent receptor n=1 Tax=Paraflavitalea speifideaquila TaxID=3076558 RepID=UPI0028E9D41E|nr:hypothetical protein [Paraflavitalea speifideiaquila]
MPPAKDTVVPGKVRSGILINGTEGNSALSGFGGIIELDGVKYDSVSIRSVELKAENIERIDVLKGESAESEYGSSGKNGVIRITTKKKADNKITAAPLRSGDPVSDNQKGSYVEITPKPALLPQAASEHLITVTNLKKGKCPMLEPVQDIPYR